MAACASRLASRVSRAAVSLMLLSTVELVGGAPPRRVELDFGQHGVLRWDRGSTPALMVGPRRGDGWLSMARRYCGSTTAAAALQRATPSLAQPLRDRAIRVPIAQLRADLRLEAVQALFPTDARVVLGWQHWVLEPFGGGEESWEWMAELFTGQAGDAALLRRVNPEIAADGIRRARPVLIPEGRLLAVFRRIEPMASPTVRPSPRVATRTPSATPVHLESAAGGALAFGHDDAGEYAEYRLRRGEALYSAVVVRFTGQLHAKQVNATAMEIARRSGISDVTSIPIGFAIRIPIDLVLPEYLPSEHPRRRQWEEDQRELARFVEVVHATDLSGVHVILDSGHGGGDSGAAVAGIWEAPYVYDIYCRIKANLERHTRATVWMTIKDTSRGFSVVDRDRLPQDRDQVLLTHPPYDLGQSVLGVHLRWYLTNDIILRRIGSEVPRSKTVFVSVHADSLHPSVRGAMAYVPSRYLRPDRYSPKLKALSRYKEYRNNPTVQLSATFKARSEAASRRLADEIIASLRHNDLRVHPHRPVRDRVLRGRRSYVPAVLRYSLAQHSVLVECSNLANTEDRKQLLEAAWRERFARSVVEGMAAAFSGE